MTDCWVFSFPKPDEYLSLNGRIHHMKRYRLEQSWQQATWAHAVNAISRGRLWRDSPPCIVKVRLPVVSVNKRRDPHNYVATVKPIVDALVMARVWPDDTAEWVSVVDPVFHEGRMVIVELTRS